MKRGSIIIGVLIIAAIIGVSLFYYLYYFSKTEGDQFVENMGEKVSIFGRNGDGLTEESVSEMDTLNFAFQLGKEYSDINFCDKFRSFHYNFLGACYAGVAISTDDYKLCDKAPPPDSITECYSILAYLKKDISLCNDVDGWSQPWCLLRAGYGIKDYNICDTIKVPDSPRMSDPIESCRIGVGVAIKDPSICGKVKSGISRSDCYKRIAVEMKNQDICHKIEDSSRLKDECYSEVGLSRLDYSICNNDVLENVSRINCFINILKCDPDLEVCNIYKDDFPSITCYQIVAMKDVSICEQIKELEDYAEFQKTIPDYQDVSGSEGLSNFFSYDVVGKCISNVARYTGEIKLCDKIESIAGIEYCQEKVNKLLEKKAICDTIEKQDLKEECKEILTR